MIRTALIIATLATPAAGQGRNCGPRADVLTKLAANYGETRQSIGMTSNNAVVETFASLETGTWTIAVTQANGLTCLIASGQSFERLTEKLPPKGDDL